MALSLSLEIEHSVILNYALMNSAVDFIGECRLTNLGDETAAQLMFSLSFDGGFIDPIEAELQPVEPGQTLRFTPRLRLHAKELYALTSTMRDSFTIEITSKTQNLEKPCRFVGNFDVLPPDHWSGSQVMPETIAPFVMPNLPQIKQLVVRAGKNLEELSGEHAFSAYDSRDKNVVRRQMAAIYQTIREEDISYAQIQPDFFRLGQRVRMPGEALGMKQGNCIEMAVLFASVAEACGLYPLIFLIEGHAFAGCWLKEELFESNVVRDYTTVQKRIADGINDIEAFECTYMNAGRQKDFEQACRAARGELDSSEDFLCVIDIYRAHMSGYRPLPVKSYENGEVMITDYGLCEDAKGTGKTTKTLEEHFLDTTREASLSKGEIWMRHLLDLSKRNNLISFRPGKNCVQLFCFNLAELEDRLAGGTVFELAAAPREQTFKTSRINLAEVEGQKEYLTKLVEAEFSARRLRVFVDEEHLETVLKGIYRSAKKALEEDGAGTLYVSLGLLRWTDPSDPRGADGRLPGRYAPLVLLPVDLIRLAGGTYRLALRDEDPQLNITILEMLRQDFDLSITGLTPLPQDDKGIDLPLVFNSIRRAVMHMDGWDVEEAAFLGLFSFSQFVIWNDLNARFDTLTRNKVVRGLVDGFYADQSNVEIRPDMLETSLRANDLVIPGSVDSSQMAAVIEATRGSSFVLHGPPGTGKSQTILNMISNALYQGKTVLFVAEKMAALNVVKDRLEGLGLGDFCLELHSNKTNKTVVLEKLSRNLSSAADFDTGKHGDFLRRGSGMLQLRNELSEHVKELHEPRPQGRSLYDMIALYREHEDSARPFHFTRESLEELDAGKFESWEEAVRRLGIAAEGLRFPCGSHPLKDFQKNGYSLNLRDRLPEAIGAALSALGALEEAISSGESAAPRLGDFRVAHLLFGRLTELSRLFRDRNIKLPLTADALEKLMDPDTKAALQRALESARAASAGGDSGAEDLLADYNRDILKFDWRACKEAYLEACGTLFFKGGKIRQALAPLAVLCKASFTLPSDDKVLAEFDRIAEAQEKAGARDALLAKTAQNLGCPELAEADDPADAIEDLLVLRNYLRMEGAETSGTAAWYSLYRVMQGLNTKEAGGCEKLLEKYRELLVKLYELSDLTGIDVPKLLALPYWLRQLREKLTGYQVYADEWKAWSLFYGELENLRAIGLSAVADGILRDEPAGEAGTTDSPDSADSADSAAGAAGEPGQAGRAETAASPPESFSERLRHEYLASVSHDLIALWLSESPELMSFNGRSFSARIEAYNNAMDEFEKLCREQIAMKLYSEIPHRFNCTAAEARQLALLLRIIRSKGRGTSIRSLFSQCGSLLRRVTPCLLMSPLSVAQYLDPTAPPFDLVIFDEASQIPTAMAVGAMSRGKDVIIVGDPNQMPPTSFFGSHQADENNLELEDLESLLEDCLAINMPQRFLSWHYRSQSESLIRFSNVMYYASRMNTFPSPFDRLSRVTFVKVNGIYDRGLTRTNRAEAEAIVAELLRRLRDPELRKDSVGVVTFNLAQQNLIDDLFQEALARDPELEKLTRELDEPVFIKNLENVQGDERDIILFSVCYAADKDGYFSQNFGPLNQRGGWRRLNVAVTRSRKQMTLYSSIDPERINISPTSPEGVKGLRYFLSFAKNGSLSFETETGGRHKAPAEDPLSLSIRSFLQNKGYKVDSSIGSSGFKLDLAIVDPRCEDYYLAYIQIDGRQYASAETTRDRSRLLPSVLRRKGWLAYNIWALDWFDQRELEEQKLLAFIEGKLAEPLPPAAEALLRRRAEPQAAPAPAPEAPKKPKRQAPKPAGPPTAVPFVKFKGKDIYESGALTEDRERVETMMKAIIEEEGPIFEEDLLLRVCEHFGGARLTKGNLYFLARVLEHTDVARQTDKAGCFYWPDKMDPRVTNTYRVPAPDEKRDPARVSLAELAVLMADVASGHLAQGSPRVTAEEDELVREASKALGYVRAGERVTERLKSAIELAIRHKWLERNEADGSLEAGEFLKLWL